MMDFNPDLYLTQLRQCRHLPESAMKHLCQIVRARLMEESNVQPVSSPVTVCGDIHGQLWDLLELLRVGGEAPGTSYVFMVRLLCYCRTRRDRGETEEGGERRGDGTGGWSQRGRRLDGEEARGAARARC